MSYDISPSDALVIVDVQHDFLPGGALAVAEGDRIFAPINALAPRFSRVYATRDWHPPNHSSFAAQGGPWPVHCVANSHGAGDLRMNGISRVFVCGLATDYCVKATALDAKEAGFEVVVLRDAAAAVNVQPGDEAQALDELAAHGVDIATSTEVSG
jgi:nicotinamidase/pyrazinamidase